MMMSFTEKDLGLDAHYTKIKETLRAIQHEALRVRLLEGACLLGTLLLMLLLVGFFLAAALSFPYGRSGYLLVCFALLAYTAYRYVLVPVLPLRQEDRLALFIEGRLPGLKDRLISSLQLGRDLKDTHRSQLYSHELIASLFKDTANRMEGLSPQSLIKREGLKKKALALAGVGLFFTSLVISYPGDFRERYGLLVGPAVAEAPGPPIIGDICLTYRYPLYTGLEPKTARGSSGDIKALKGSEVEIVARSSHPLASANLVVNKASKIPMEVEGANTIKGRLIILEGGNYSFETTPLRGKTPSPPAADHSITVEEDRYPEVSIIFPSEKKVVSETEVVRLVYLVQDDFGLKEVRLIPEGKPGERVLKTFEEGAREYRDSFNWDLAGLKLGPGDKVPYHLEAVDNDSVSGPKVARSRTQYLEVYSSEQRHKELLSLQDQLLREMTHLLAEELVNPPKNFSSRDTLLLKEESLRERATNLLGLFDKVLSGMQEDRLANYAVYYGLENMRSRFSQLSEQREAEIERSLRRTTLLPLKVVEKLQLSQEGMVTELEGDIMFLVELLRKQRLDDFLHMDRSLENSEKALTRLLEDLGKGATSEDRVRQEIQKLEEIVRAMMEKLFQMSSHWGDEFLNLEALKGLGELELNKELEAMREALARGDIESALRAALRALDSLEKMMSQMGAHAQQYADSTYSRTLKEMHGLDEKLRELEEAEGQLAQDTERLKKDVQSRTSGEMDQALGEFFKRQHERLEAMKENLAGLEKLFSENPALKNYSIKEKEVSKFLRKRDQAMRSPFFLGRPAERGLSPEDMEELNEKMAELNKARRKDPLLDTYGALSRALPDIKEKLSQLGDMLKGWDTKESLGMARDSLKDLGFWDSEIEGRPGKEPAKEFGKEAGDKLSSARQLNEEMVKELESLSGSFEEKGRQALTHEEKSQFKGLAKRQGEMEKGAEDLGQSLSRLSHDNPSMGPEAGERLEEARGSMGKATEKLEGEDGPGALVEERESLYKLAQARKGLGQAMERVAKGMMSRGMPMPQYVLRYREVWGEGERGVSTGEVEIPSKEAYTVPKEFRQDILDSMKQGLPQKYEELNKDYYRKLVE